MEYGKQALQTHGGQSDGYWQKWSGLEESSDLESENQGWWLCPVY